MFISDRKAVCFNLNLWKPVNERKTVVAHKLKGFDFGAFNEMTILTGLSDGCVLQCIESLAKEYDEMLCKALDKLAPKKTRTIVIQPNAPWYCIMRRSPFRRGRGEGSNINGVQLVLKLIG